MTSDLEEPSLDPIPTKEPLLGPVSTQEPSLDPVTIKEQSLDPIPTKEPLLDPVSTEELTVVVEDNGKVNSYIVHLIYNIYIIGQH